MKIIELTGQEAARLCAELITMINDQERPWRTIKVAIDGGGFKYKIGEGMWTPSLGHDLNAPPPLTEAEHRDISVRAGHDGSFYTLADKRRVLGDDS